MFYIDSHANQKIALKKIEFLAAYNSVYRYEICISESSPSQTSSQSDDFLSNFEKLSDNAHILQPAYSVILGDFNARSKSWQFNDSITMEGSRLDSLVQIRFFRLMGSINLYLNRLIYCRIHCLALTLSLLINQVQQLVDSGVHPALHKNCHHQITYCKLNLKIVYPPPYDHLVWDFKKADVNAITTAINQIDWKFLFFL